MSSEVAAGSVTGTRAAVGDEVFRDTDDLYRIIELIVGIPGVVRSSAVLVLKEISPRTVTALLERLSGS
jgi:hypothetical protein